MEENIRVTGARYQQIAADIASKIVNHQYVIGEKIYARSLIASQYAVSSETARKAIAILADLNIVETFKGSGVIITSYENAVAFLKQFRNIGTISELKQDAINSLAKLNKDGVELRDAIGKLVDHTERFRALNPLSPFSVQINGDSPWVGQSASSLNFWQNTAATFVAIRRSDAMVISPGPYAEFRAGDTIYFVGEEECIERVNSLMEQEVIAE